MTSCRRESQYKCMLTPNAANVSRLAAHLAPPPPLLSVVGKWRSCLQWFRAMLAWPLAALDLRTAKGCTRSSPVTTKWLSTAFITHAESQSFTCGKLKKQIQNEALVDGYDEKISRRETFFGRNFRKSKKKAILSKLKRQLNFKVVIHSIPLKT